MIPSRFSIHAHYLAIRNKYTLYPLCPVHHENSLPYDMPVGTLLGCSQVVAHLKETEHKKNKRKAGAQAEAIYNAWLLAGRYTIVNSYSSI